MVPRAPPQPKRTPTPHPPDPSPNHNHYFRPHTPNPGPNPGPNLGLIPYRRYHTSGANGEPGLHAHMDAGMNICTGHALRAALFAAHDGQSFFEFLRQLVHGAQTIPHGSGFEVAPHLDDDSATSARVFASGGSGRASTTRSVTQTAP